MTAHIDKPLPHAYAYSHVESERLRQQTRANAEAIKACEAEERLATALRRGDDALSEVHDLCERLEKLQAVADIAQGILLSGDLHWHTPQAERTARERDLRDALSRLPNAKDDRAAVGGSVSSALLGADVLPEQSNG
jgi:hypothetical protein